MVYVQNVKADTNTGHSGPNGAYSGSILNLRNLALGGALFLAAVMNQSCASPAKHKNLVDPDTLTIRETTPMVTLDDLFSKNSNIPSRCLDYKGSGKEEGIDETLYKLWYNPSEQKLSQDREFCTDYQFKTLADDLKLSDDGIKAVVTLYAKKILQEEYNRKLDSQRKATMKKHDAQLALYNRFKNVKGKESVAESYKKKAENYKKIAEGIDEKRVELEYLSVTEDDFRVVRAEDRTEDILYLPDIAKKTKGLNPKMTKEVMRDYQMVKRLLTGVRPGHFLLRPGTMVYLPESVLDTPYVIQLRKEKYKGEIVIPDAAPVEKKEKSKWSFKRTGNDRIK